MTDSSSSLTQARSADVQSATSLGWRVAQIYVEPFLRPAVRTPTMGAFLPNTTDFRSNDKAAWLAEEIGKQANSLFSSGLPDDLKAATAAVIAAVGNDQTTDESLRNVVYQLHCVLLKDLTIAHFSLGKAYDLGASLASMVLWAGLVSDDIPGRMKASFSPPRVDAVYNWLVELKTLLPDHAAYAIARGLEHWQNWVASTDHSSGEWPLAQRMVITQATNWRSLITGEKSAVDTLNTKNYIDAARFVARKGWGWAARHWYLLLLGMAVTAGVIAIIFSLRDVSQNVRVVASLVWLGGAIGLSFKGFVGTLGGVLKNVEGRLWQSELDEAVAEQNTVLPANAVFVRRKSKFVGALDTRPTEFSLLAPTPSESSHPS